MVETHRGAEVADAVPGRGREDGLRLGDVLQARVEDLHVKVQPRVWCELPFEILQWEHELRHLSLRQPELKRRSAAGTSNSVLTACRSLSIAIFFSKKPRGWPTGPGSGLRVRDPAPATPDGNCSLIWTHPFPSEL